MPKIFNNEDDRLQRLAELSAEESPDWLERFKPGTFGCHELLDRASWIANLLEESVLSHPACLSNPEWFALADRALAALTDLYQKVGEVHLGDKGNAMCNPPNES